MTPDEAKPSAADKASASTSPESDAAPPVEPMRTRRVLRIGIAALLVLIGLLIVGILPRLSLRRELEADATRASSTLPLVAISKASRPTSPTTLLLPATMEALHEVSVYARVSGYVSRWYADIGKPVHAGELLAEITVPELNQQVLQARAQVEQAQSALSLARSNYERWRQLLADSAVTVQEYQQMKQAYDAAAAAVRAAQANLGVLRATQSYTRVRAPFSGVVTARSVDNGSLISAAGASATPLTAGNTQLAPPTSMSAGSLFRIAQTDTLRAYIDVPEPDVHSLRPGLSADIVVGEFGDRVFHGKVVRTAHAVDLQTRTLLAEVIVPNLDRLLLPGMYAQLRVSVQRTVPPLLVPSTALANRSRGPQVLELIPGNGDTAMVRVRVVKVGRDYGTTLEIVSGLSDGAWVATIGTQVLVDGQKVRIRRR